MSKIIGWLTHESALRLAEGGNCRGTVPLHKRPTIVSQVPVCQWSPTVNAAPALLEFAQAFAAWADTLPNLADNEELARLAEMAEACVKAAEQGD